MPNKQTTSTDASKLLTMPVAKTLRYPLKDYLVNGLGFLQEAMYAGVYWGYHLGEDIVRPANTPIYCIGRGRVVYSALHPGSAKKGNWGNVIIIAHTHPVSKKIFYSLYAHMNERRVAVDEIVRKGHKIGTVGRKNTPENGWWVSEHLHFGIYTGKWNGQVLPGYWTKGSVRTKKEDWFKPSDFIAQFPINKGFSGTNT